MMVTHRSNRAAFAGRQQDEPGFRTYCLLVALELTLKDEIVAKGGKYPASHDLSCLITTLIPSVPSSLEAALNSVKSTLTRLQCSDKDGNSSCVRAEQFPDLRYLRHSADGWGTGATTQEDLKIALSFVQQLADELRKAHGVNP